MNLNINDEGMENLTDIKRINQIIVKLTEILKAEYNHIKKMEVDKIDELQTAKIPLMKWLNIFQNYVTIVNPKFFNEINDEQRQQFLKYYQDFQDVVKQNHDEIEKAIIINQHVAGMIYDDVKKQQIMNVYGQKASLAKFSLKKNDSDEDKLPIIIDLSA